MAKNILVISCDYRETRAALIENGIIAELHIERKGRQSGTVGNVYLGKVTRVLPGLQAAFIDIGQERAAFLHVEDLIRPDDFDEYLAGGRKLARGEETSAAETEEDSAEAADGAPAEAEAPAAIVEAHGGVPESEVDSGTEIVDVAAPVEIEPTSAVYSEWNEAPHTRREGRRQNGSSTGRRALSAETNASLVSSDSSPPSEAPETQAAPPSEQPLISAAALSSTLVLPNPSSSTLVIAPSSRALLEDEDDEEDADEADPSDDSGEDAVALDESAQDLPAESEHSFHSQPTLDELPDDGSGSDRPSALPADREAETTTALEDEDDDLLGDMPGFTISEPGEPVPRAPAPRTAGGERERGERGGRRRRRGRGRSGDQPAGEQRSGGGGGGGGAREADARGGGRSRGRDGRSGGRDGRSGGRDGRGRDGRSGGRDGGRSGQGLPGRLSKSTPIREVVKEGQEIIVQVTKDPIGTKGARCSSHISLPGRYVVYLPTVDHIGISKRIGNDKERARLREAIEAMKPPSGGLIVRTVAEGLTKKGLKQDVGYLVRLWGEIAKKREGARSPYMLSSELDLVLKVARDLFTDEVDEVVIDDKQQYDRLCRFVEMFAPDRIKDVKLYDEEEPIFDEYGIEDEIGRALSRKVPLPSGGYLIIDQAEALTAIDVNTGRFVGKGSKDMEETILKTNLEAVNEIAYQLRFRNIGGLIILDLIDMEQHKNREKVRRTLEELLQKDKAKTTLNRISDLGLIEMTRKRTRESLGRLLHEPCFYCDGTGQLQSKDTIAYEILREIRRKRGTLPGYSVVVNAHPAVADVLNGPEKAAVADAENRFMRKIMVVPRKEYHLEQFDLQGK
jgi:ribonuclease G